jgi:hypothetical protein
MAETSRTRSRTAGLGVPACLALAALTLPSPTEASRVKLGQWETLKSARYGFMIAYPGTVFTPRVAAPGVDGPGPDSPEAHGHVLVSHDGNAKLLVGAFENELSASLIEYRAQLLSDNYSGADLDYAPVKKRWFIVSGTQGDMHFYERVNFTCGGRLINSWALLYPVAERHIYDRVVEAIARTYTPGAGATGRCD